MGFYSALWFCQVTWKTRGLHNHNTLLIICFPLPSKSFHLVTDFKPDTTRGTASERHSSYRVRVKTSLRKLQLEFGLYSVCKSATMWHKPIPRKARQECPPESTQATCLRKRWLLWGHSALNFELSAMPFRGSSRFPTEMAVKNPLQHTIREHMLANGKDVCLRKQSKKKCNT